MPHRVIDPSGILKKGRHSVGVGRQYCGNLGKVDNCQIGVFSALGRGRVACLINKRLYLPKDWCQDPSRSQKAGIPQAFREYKKRAQLALELVDNADVHGLEYSWIGLDAEFGVPWFISALEPRDKQFLIDVASNAKVYPTNPRLSYRPKGLGSKGLCLTRKSKQVSALRRAHGRRRWRRVEIRGSSKRVMVAEFLHKRVWFWDQEQDYPPRRYHLLIRRTQKAAGGVDGCINIPPANASTQRLAYQQSQRFWVEQSIRDAKDGLGLDEYQARKWNAWQHHVALTMLAGLFVMKMILANRDSMPLLSITDVREILRFILPKKDPDLEDVPACVIDEEKRIINGPRREAHRLS